jgi:hypothetical protein
MSIDELFDQGISEDTLKRLEKVTSNMNIIPIQAATAFRSESDMLNLIESQKRDEINKDVQEKIQKDMNLSESPTSKSMISSRLSRIHKLTENTQEETKMDIGVMKSSQNEDSRPIIKNNDIVELKSINDNDDAFLKEKIKNRITTAALDTIVNSVKLFYPNFETSWYILESEESDKNVHISVKDTTDALDNTMSMKFKKSQFENISFPELVAANIAGRCFPREFHKKDDRYELFLNTTNTLLNMLYKEGER